MFCGNCGTQNQDGTAFCENCGAPLVADVQPEYVPAAPKKNWKPIIIGAVAAIVVIVLLIILLGGGSGKGSPEDAALTFVEGTVTADIGMIEEVMLPQVVDHEEWDNVKEEMEEAEEMYDQFDISLEDIEAGDVEDVSKSQIEELEDEMNSELDDKVEITDAKRVEIKYEVSSSMGSNNDTMWVTVIEVDGDWYAMPGF